MMEQPPMSLVNELLAKVTNGVLPLKDFNELVQAIIDDPGHVLPQLEHHVHVVSDTGTTLAMAFAGDHAELLKRVLELGVDPNKQDANGVTALHEAADVFGSFACCEILVQFGANPNIRAKNGHLPFMVAIGLVDETIQRFLIGQGGEICKWDPKVFKKLCKWGCDAALKDYLDLFRVIPNPPRQTCETKVCYRDMHFVYGPPWLPVNRTPLSQVLNGDGDVPSAVGHPVFHYILEVKWRAFAHSMFKIESTLFLSLLVSTYMSFILPTASMLAKCMHVVSILGCTVFLLLEGIDWSQRRSSYFHDVTNWINLVAYTAVLGLDVCALSEANPQNTAMVKAVIIVVLCGCGVEYLRIFSLTSLLIAMMFKMIEDVVKFLALYTVFQVAFSAAFFLMFQDEDSRYNNYGQSFLATFLMLFGDLDSDLFLQLSGAKAVVGNGLVLLYLVGAMVMLLNLLIAMMSTSYEQVADSARTARSLARAELVLRMENLLPQSIRESKYDALLETEDRRVAHWRQCQQERTAAKRSEPGADSDAIEFALPVEESDKTGPSALLVGADISEKKTAVNRVPVSTSNMQNASAAAGKPSRWSVVDTYATLDDFEQNEVVEGTASVEDELSRVHEQQLLLQQQHREHAEITKTALHHLDERIDQQYRQLERVLATQCERLEQRIDSKIDGVLAKQALLLERLDALTNVPMDRPAGHKRSTKGQ